jgi:CheY-like chemotaxis protein
VFNPLRGKNLPASAKTVTLVGRVGTFPKTVLVAEDDPNDVRLLELAAQQFPASEIKFQIVRDGEEALAYLRGEGAFSDRQAHPLPDLVLLDVRMPRLDGFQVLQWIRSRPDFRQLKVFIWADSQFHSDISRAQEAGADRVIPKPNQMAALREILREIKELLGPGK